MAVFGAGSNLVFTGLDELKLTPSVVQIIEQNVQTQIDTDEGYKEISWVDGLPATVEIWEDSSKSKKLWTKTYEYTDGLITKAVVTNEDDGSVKATTITWQDGVPVVIDRA
jgi:hypothetical protein